ncbi:MAG: DNA primase [Phenylobacterium sp.]|uniref:DNA primase n=1 Tax=Phenylobacterium sp. TaxID=1871053 RepID=UPI001A5AF0F3|nr:DNA primase [Phenylobacterium sp.]MBL8556605.1 DNA primase [Phenylobacterium sp.]
MVGRFDERFLEEIKSRLRPSDVIGRTVKLRKQGREYVGLSPFNKEKTPSFYVNDDKGMFFDFSSGKTGDLITYLQETERLSFAEAVERLAGEAGLALPEVDPRGAEQEKQRQGLADWLELAAQWFEAELKRPPGREARAYLERRGLPESEWARFRIGFSPNGRTALKDYLVTKGAKPGELVEAGLLIAPEESGSAPYDRFRDRIIFPILDARGRVVSFGGRAMDPQARAKYLNGPETVVFHKGHHLYGLSEARKILAAAKADEAPPLVVVEGYMDVIACQRAGVPAVAAMGTALGEEQMEVLWRHHPEPTLCFDGDRAGRQAAARAMERALPLLKPGKSFRFAIVEGGKDPDDVLREQGPAVLRQQLSQTTPFAEALFIRERDAEPLDTPERKASLKVRLRKLAAGIADGDLAQAYKEDLLGRFEQLSPPRQAPVYEAGAAGRALSRHGWAKRRAALAGATPEAKDAAERMRRAPRALPAALARAALLDPTVIDDAIERVGSHGFGDEQLDKIARELVRLRYETEHLEMETLQRRLLASGISQDDLDRVQREAERAGVAAPFLRESGERARLLWRQAFDLLMQLESLERAAEAARQDIARDPSALATLATLKAERDHLRRLINSDWASGEDEAHPVLPH